MITYVIRRTAAFFYGEEVKVLILTFSYFCIIASYTLVRELRDVIFIQTVGQEHFHLAQIFSVIGLIPALLFYAYLVDHLKKQQLLYCYTLAYAFGTLLMALGIQTLTGPQAFIGSTIFGWAQYLFVEGYSAFVISSFWAFVNSITPVTGASRSYSFLVAGSKLGGMLTAASAWCIAYYSWFSDTRLLQCFLIAAASFIMVVPFLISYLIKHSQPVSLEGYQAYARDDDFIKSESTTNRLFAGLRLMISYPYVGGIFGLVFAWEAMNVVLNYQRLGLCVAACPTLHCLSTTLFQHIFLVHAFSFLIACFANHASFRSLSERQVLVGVPILTGLLSIVFFMCTTPAVAFACSIAIRALNYSLALSAREMLYIPTTRDTRFKSKSWIDAFGAKCARGFGALYSVGAQASLSKSMLYLVLCICITAGWIAIAYYLSKRFERAIKHNEVIG